MKKIYFLGYDFYNEKEGWSRFHHSITEIDLEKEKLMDVVRMIMTKVSPDINLDEVTIKVTAFNNIE